VANGTVRAQQYHYLKHPRSLHLIPSINKNSTQYPERRCGVHSQEQCGVYGSCQTENGARYQMGNRHGRSTLTHLAEICSLTHAKVKKAKSWNETINFSIKKTCIARHTHTHKLQSPLKSQAKNKQQQEAKAKSKAPYISSRSPIQEAKHEK